MADQQNRSADAFATASARAVRAARALVLVFVAGCAPLPPYLNIQRFGPADPSLDQEITESAEEISVTASEVRVVVGRVPEGLEISDSGSTMAVRQGFESAYYVVGSVEADLEAAFSAGLARNFYWTWNYSENWRKVFCYPQVPLKLVTLGMWNLVPLGYPCIAHAYFLSQQERDAALVDALRRAAKALGGNLVVVVRTHNHDVMKGFVVKTWQRQKRAPARTN